MPGNATDAGKNNGRKHYKTGDHIHIIVTRDFAQTATEFFAFCRKHHFNPSEVIRANLKSWLRNKKQAESPRVQEEIVSSILREHPWFFEELARQNSKEQDDQRSRKREV